MYLRYLLMSKELVFLRNLSLLKHHNFCPLSRWTGAGRWDVSNVIQCCVWAAELEWIYLWMVMVHFCLMLCQPSLTNSYQHELCNIGKVLTLCMLGNFLYYFVVYCLFSKLTFSKNYFRKTFRMSNSLDPEQAWHFVKPDLGPNYLQRSLTGHKICC